VKGEELERSLNAEFEGYLRETLEEVRRELSQFEESVLTEIENQKRRLEELFSQVKERIPEQKELDPGFRASVLEHLRLARDEGAQITAMAMAEAEELERKTRAAEPGFADLSEAIREISMKTTQADILKSLMSYAEKFSGRGALFIVKNERFVGWRAFGEEKEQKEELIKSVVLPVASRNILAEAVNSLTTVDVSDSDYLGDTSFLRNIGYGSDRMVAIPLIVRGRGVAVLYADKGSRKKIYVEALESLARVASMTVEILASLKSAAKRSAAEEAVKEKHEPQAASTPAYQETYQPTTQPTYTEYAETSVKPEAYRDEEKYAYKERAEYREAEEVSQPAEEIQKYEPQVTYEEVTYEETKPVSEAFTETIESFKKAEEVYAPPVAEEQKVEIQQETTAPAFEEVHTVEERVAEEPVHAEEPVRAEESVHVDETVHVEEPVHAEEPVVTEVSTRAESYQPVQEPSTQIPVETSYSYREEAKERVVEEPKTAETFKPKEAEPGRTLESAVSPSATTPHISRLGDRPIDLPVEVSSEEERRYHNEARRFARLLVSEIKLYNEKKVREGREAGDLYDRLREAIDRSREMYDKRVKPIVAAKFDYFHYELVHSLAEGDVSKLGENYPGPSV